MQHYRILEHSVVIAPNSRKPYYLSYRQEYPEDDIVLLTVEQLEGLFLYHHDDRAIRYLIAKGLGYHEAKDVLQALTHINLEKTYRSKRLNQYKGYAEELVKLGFLYKDEYAARTFLGRNIVIDGYPEGGRISRALDNVPNISMNWLPNPDEKLKSKGIARFSNIYGELHYVCNRIACLIEKGTDPEDILISGYSEEYRLALSLMSKAYGFTVNLPPSSSLFETEFGKDVLNGLDALEILDEHAIANLLEQLKERYGSHQRFEKVVKSLFGLLVPDIPKSKQIQVYAEALKEIKAPSYLYEGAIDLLNEDYPVPGKHIFRIDCNLSNSPAIRSDNDFLFDEEKKELGMMTSTETNLEAKKRLIAFLLDPSIEMISYHVRHLNNEKNPCGLLRSSPQDPEEDFPLYLEKTPQILAEYSKEFAKLWGAHLLDNAIQFKTFSPELGFLAEELGVGSKRYDNIFHPFDAAKNPEGDLKVSASSLDTYYKCPFRYYCGYLLKIDDSETTFSALVGTIFHDVLSHAYDEGFDSRQAYDDAVAIQEEKRGEPFSIQEQVLLENLYETFLQVTLDFLREHHDLMLSPYRPGYEPEYSLEYHCEIPLSDHFYLRGSADKIIKTNAQTTDDHGVPIIQKYATFIDYKTYAKSFSRGALEYGFSLQLPIYAFMASKLPEFNDAKTLGLFIARILPSEIYGKDGKSLEKVRRDAMKLSGVYLEDTAGLSTLDSGWQDSSIVSSLWYGKNGFKSNNARVLSVDKMAEIIELTKQKIFEAGRLIRSGDFPVRSTSIKGYDEGCSFCPFSDVCYRQRYQVRVIRLKKNKEGESDA